MAYAAATITHSAEYPSTEAFLADNAAHCIDASTSSALQRALRYERRFGWHMHGVALLANPISYERPPGNVGFCYWKRHLSQAGNLGAKTNHSLANIEGSDPLPAISEAARPLHELLLEDAHKVRDSSSALWGSTRVRSRGSQKHEIGRL